MTRCVMCRRRIEEDAPEMYIIEDKRVCQACSDQVEILLSSRKRTEIQRAMQYVRSCQKQTEDPEVDVCLNVLLNQTETTLEKMSAQAKPKKMAQAAQPKEPASSPVQPEKAEEMPLFVRAGRKLKSLSKILCLVYMVLLAIYGFLLGTQGYYIGLAIMILGPLGVWLIHLVLYALGDLLEKTQENNRLLARLVELEEKKR